ncbi:hypothetical protein Y1Q_0002950 [Alligator mississippiensis]|uniref:Uncharacterized protein n=1 Tax=Alligator mississippiensis TaxID=8496 RepID=A0A151MCU1_ALLMI|nr:hypothetical protein Y1Q_0002950 [Alligator mississippiensis]
MEDVGLMSHFSVPNKERGGGLLQGITSGVCIIKSSLFVYLFPPVYLRYLDVIFVICMHGKESIEKFHRSFNNLHLSIKLTLEYSTQQIHFLDTTVKVCSGHIATPLYWKPTDCNSYLPDSAFITSTSLDPLPTAKLYVTAGSALIPPTR